MCMQVMDVHVKAYSVDLMSIISGVYSSTTHRFQLRLHSEGTISYNSLSHLVFLQVKGNSAQYNAQVLLSFLRQEGDVLFQQDNARPHIAAATQRALRCDNNCPGQ